MQAELSESLPDEDEKNDHLLNEAKTEKLTVRNILYLALTLFTKESLNFSMYSAV